MVHAAREAEAQAAERQADRRRVLEAAAVREEAIHRAEQEEQRRYALLVGGLVAVPRRIGGAYFLTSSSR